ncbi:unnamed protein product [Laminaria digitata]
MMKARMFGHQSSATRKAFRDTIVACNSLAMFSLGRSDPTRCRDLLTRALDLASDTNIAGDDRGGGTLIGRDSADGDPALQVLTLNNTACLHRRLGEPKRALRCLRRAARVGRQSSGSEHLEVTHLNACAVLSELGRHEEALEHARSAVFYGQERDEVGTQRGGWEGGNERLGGAGSRRARLATLAVSYYNLAVELEYTRRYQACLRWYDEALKLACDPDVQNDGLIQTFQRSYAQARKKKHAPHLLRRSGVAKDPAARDGTPNRYDVPYDRGSPVANADHTAPPRSYGSVSKNNGVRTSEADGGRLRRAEWPELGRVKRQRAGDERRSKTTDRNNRNVTNVSGTASPVTSSAASCNGVGVGREASPQQQRLSDGREESVAIQAARKKPARSGGGSGGSVGGPELRRKRPASADISRDRNLGGRAAHREDMPQIPTISEAARLSVKPKWQPLGEVGRSQAPFDNNRLGPGAGAADNRIRRRPPNSRLSMSAHSRLGEGSRSRGDSTAVPAIGRDGRSGGHDSNARVNRLRWSTAGVMRQSASQPMPSIARGDDGVGGQRSGRGGTSNSILRDGREISPGLDGERTGSRRSGKATAEGQPRLDDDRAVAASRTPDGRRIRFASSASASEVIIRQTTKSSTELGARVESDSPATTPLRRAGRAVAERRAENSRAVDGGTCERAKVSPSPQKATDVSEEKRNSPRESNFDDGRDGNIYLNPWSGGEQPCGLLGSLGSEVSDVWVDNGRDGKFYLGFETDTQQCGLISLESDCNSFGEEGEKGADRTFDVEAARVIEEVAVDEEPVELANEHTKEESSVGGSASAQQRADAARTIRNAVAVAVLRRRSPRYRVDRETQRMLSDATGTGEGRGESRTAPLEKISGLAAIDHHVSIDDHVSTATGADSSDTTVKTECKLGRTAVDRRTLAASAIRVWLARACLARRLQRRRVRDLHLRWEPEIRRIAATRIQSVARAAARRRHLKRMGWAALEIQRAVRGWRARSIAKGLALKMPEGHGAACEKIQRLFRDYRGRQRTIRKRQIAWEETIVHHGAAGVIQSCWHRHRSRRLVRPAPHQQILTAPPLSAPAPAPAPATTERTATSSSSSHPTPSSDQNPAQLQVPHLWRGAQAGASIYALWGAFTSLLTATATRRTVRRAIATALLGPAATTFALFNRDCRTAADTATAADSVFYSFSASPPRTETSWTEISCDPENFDCAPRSFRRKIDAAARRMEGVVRARTASLSIVRAAVGATGFVGDGDDGGGIVGGGGGCEKDSAAPVEARGRMEEVARAEAGSLVLQAVEVCADFWTLISSRNSGSLVGLEDERVAETLTEVLSGTLQFDERDNLNLILRPAELLTTLCRRKGRVLDTATGAEEGCGIRLPPHHDLQPPPKALVRTLASSAAASLLFHPDFADTFTSHEDDGGVFSEEWRADESDDYSRLVAEVCSCLLLVPRASKSSGGGGGGGGGGGELSSENDTNDQPEIDRNEAVTIHTGMDSSPAAPSSSPLSLPACYPREKDRSQLLLSVVQLVDETAEEIA